MNVGGMTWQQAADALGCSTAAMAQWKTGKTGPSKKTMYRLEMAELKVGIKPAAAREAPGVYETGGFKRELLTEMGGIKKALDALSRRVDDFVKRLK